MKILLALPIISMLVTTQNFPRVVGGTNLDGGTQSLKLDNSSGLILACNGGEGVATPYIIFPDGGALIPLPTDTCVSLSCNAAVTSFTSSLPDAGTATLQGPLAVGQRETWFNEYNTFWYVSGPPGAVCNVAVVAP